MTALKKELGLRALAEAAACGQTPYISSSIVTFDEAAKGSNCVGDEDYLNSSDSEDEENDELSKVRISKNERKWFKKYFLLKRYEELHGDCIVPRGFSQNPRLGTWVAVQRKQYRLYLDKRPSSMTEDRIDLLNELHFAWNAQEVAWFRHFTNFKQFREEFGHINVPVEHPRYPKLYLWVREQRRHYSLMTKGHKSHMTQERVNCLNSISFCWDTCEAQWNGRLQELADFQREHGHCIIPANHEKYSKLGAWVSNQRRVYKNTKEGKAGYMPVHRVKALEDIGFKWTPRCT